MGSFSSLLCEGAPTATSKTPSKLMSTTAKLEPNLDGCYQRINTKFLFNT